MKVKIISILWVYYSLVIFTKTIKRSINIYFCECLKTSQFSDQKRQKIKLKNSFLSFFFLK